MPIISVYLDDRTYAILTGVEDRVGLPAGTRSWLISNWLRATVPDVETVEGWAKRSQPSNKRKKVKPL